MVTMAGLSSWLCLGKSVVLVCATATGAWGQPRGHLQPMAAFARGRVLLLGCCAALPCLVISRSPQLGRWVSFWHSSVVLHLTHSISGPSGEQTPSSGYLPFEAFQKGERVLKTEKLF